MVRRRFQSVPGSVFEVLPEISSFMGFGPPCRYELSFVTGAIGVGNGDLDAVHEADGVDPFFIVLEAIIDPLHRRPVEDPGRDPGRQFRVGGRW